MPFFSAAMSASACRQLELGERRDLRRDDAHDDREAAALAEDVDAKARPLGQRVGEVAGALFLERAQRGRVVADDVAGEPRRVGHAQHRQLLDVHAATARRAAPPAAAARARNQVADAAARVEHRADHGGRAEGRRRGWQGSEQVIGEGRGIDGHHVSQRDLGRGRAAPTGAIGHRRGFVTARRVAAARTAAQARAAAR